MIYFEIGFMYNSIGLKRVWKGMMAFLFSGFDAAEYM
jgi:hypothetical protein